LVGVLALLTQLAIFCLLGLAVAAGENLLIRAIVTAAQAWPVAAGCC
jgi:IS30 family transposase